MYKDNKNKIGIYRWINTITNESICVLPLILLTGYFNIFQ